ncbi:MAG: hypothetical protein ACK40M_05605 [Flavobacteriales bacterium]
MRNLFLVLFTVGCSLTALAQEDLSFYFADAQPNGSRNLTSFPEAFRGEYISKQDSLLKVTITEDSIHVRLISFVIMTLKEVKDAPGLRLKDSLLFGIYKDRPVEVIRKNDTLIFGMETKYRMFAVSDTSVIRVCGNDLLLSSKDGNGKWTVMRISLIPRDGLKTPGVEFAYVDHDEQIKLIRSQKGLQRKQENGQTFLQLDLGYPDMQRFIEAGGFNMRQSYFRTEYH